MSFMIIENITKLDLFIYIFIFIFAIIGLFKGFVKTIYSLLKGFISLVGAYLLTEPLCDFLTTTVVHSKIKGSILEWTLEKAPSLNNIIDINNYSDQVAAATKESGIPGFIGDYISGAIKVTEEHVGMTVGDVLSNSLTNVFLTIISFVLLFVTLSILLFIIFKIFSTLIDKGGFRIVDKLLGLLTNAAIGLFIICLAFVLLNGLGVLFPSIDEWIKSYIYVEGTNQEMFSISKYIYESNPLKIIFENLFKI